MALDTDTTSRYARKHRRVDRGAVCFRFDGRELTTFQTLINPEMPGVSHFLHMAFLLGLCGMLYQPCFVNPAL